MGPAFKLLLPRHGDSRRGVVLGRVCLLRCHCVCFDCSIMRQQGQLSQKGRAAQCFVSFFFSYAFLINDGSLPVTVWCDALLLTTPRRWAAWCARPDAKIETGSTRIRSAGGIFGFRWLVYSLRYWPGGEGDGDADYLPLVSLNIWLSHPWSLKIARINRSAFQWLLSYLVSFKTYIYLSKIEIVSHPSYMPRSSPLLGGSPSEYCHKVWYKKN